MKAIAILFLTTALAAANSHFYDDADRLVRTVHPSGQTVIYTYDDADNLLSVIAGSAPVAPDGFSAERTGPTVATVRWSDRASGETGYRIERRPATGYMWESLADLPANTTSYTDSGIPAASSYVYRVLALGTGDLTSAYSAEGLAAGTGSEPFTVRSLSRGGAPGSPLELRFDADASATYTLESSTDLLGWGTATFSTTPGGAAETQVTGTSGTTAIYLPSPSGGPRYYRLVRDN